ncbi:hypothetical protein L596_023660 [Steinernema carpocapsae]|uniref:C2H2-type domain-containing protein n=1 Tax=Steinernema carpocapsae TaxID=34508 RepID=A0A4U5MF27_STECR|nr:hypothetical protein L596_023660 [Steinernema carpocapsae]
MNMLNETASAHLNKPVSEGDDPMTGGRSVEIPAEGGSRKRGFFDEERFVVRMEGALNLPKDAFRDKLKFDAADIPALDQLDQKRWPELFDVLRLSAVLKAPIGFQYLLTQSTRAHYDKFVKVIRPKFQGFDGTHEALAITFVFYEVWKTLSDEERARWDEAAKQRMYPEGVPRNVKASSLREANAWVDSVGFDKLPCVLCDAEDQRRYTYRNLLSHIVYSHYHLKIYACHHCGQAYFDERHLYEENHCREFQFKGHRLPLLKVVCTLICAECGFQYVMSGTADEKKCAEEYLCFVLTHTHDSMIMAQTLSHGVIQTDKVRLTMISRKSLLPGQCEPCEVEFNTIIEARKHFEKSHKDMEKMKCAKCPYSSCNKSAVLDHMVGQHLSRWPLIDNYEYLTFHPPAHHVDAAIALDYTGQMVEESKKKPFQAPTATTLSSYTNMVKLKSVSVEVEPSGSNRADTLALSARKEYTQEVIVNVSVESPFRDTVSGSILSEDVYFCYSCNNIMLGEAKFLRHKAICDLKRSTRGVQKFEGSIKIMPKQQGNARNSIVCPFCPENAELHCSVGSLRRHMVSVHERFANFQASNSVLASYMREWVCEREEGAMYDFASSFREHLEAAGVDLVLANGEPLKKRRKLEALQVKRFYLNRAVLKNEDYYVDEDAAQLISCSTDDHYCQFCRYTTESGRAHKAHFKKNHVFICCDCGCAFLDSEFYDEHYCMDLLPPFKGINCSLCKEQLQSTKDFYLHSIDSHFDRMALCPNSGTIYPRVTVAGLERGGTLRPCFLCTLPDFTSEEMSDHLGRHSEPDAWDRCPICRFESPDALLPEEPSDCSASNIFFHLYQVHCPMAPGNVRGCYFCKRTLPESARTGSASDVSHLIRHMIFECDESQYCLLCNDGRKLSQAIAQHRAEEHPDIFCRFSCSACELKFRTYASYRAHVETDECREQMELGRCWVFEENYVHSGLTIMNPRSRPSSPLAHQPPMFLDEDDDDVIIDEDAISDAFVARDVRKVMDSLMNSICGKEDEIVEVAPIQSSESFHFEEDGPIEVIDDDLAVVGEGKCLTTTRKEPLLQCPKCSAKFQKQVSLNHHMKEHVNDCGETIDDVFGIPRNRTVFVCRLCCLAWESYQVYQRHRQKHGHVFSCSQCNAASLHKDQVQSHYILHETIAKNRLVFACSMCSLGFHSNEGFCHHMASVHNQDLLFFCKNCGHAHSSADECLKHIYSSKCLQNDGVITVLGMTMASIFHYQPKNVAEHRAEIAADSSLVVTPSDCIHRSFTANTECMVSCPECSVLMPFSAYYHMGYQGKDSQTALRISPDDNTEPLHFTKKFYAKDLLKPRSRPVPVREEPQPDPQRMTLSRQEAALIAAQRRAMPMNSRGGMTTVTPRGPYRQFGGPVNMAMGGSPMRMPSQQQSFARTRPGYPQQSTSTGNQRNLYSITTSGSANSMQSRVPIFTPRGVRPSMSTPNYGMQDSRRINSSNISTLNARQLSIQTTRPSSDFSQAIVQTENDQMPVDFPVDPTGTLKCPHMNCDTSFTNKAQGFFHRIRHIQHKYFCMQCGRAQADEKDAVIHQFLMHIKRKTPNDIEYRLTCPCCYDVFFDPTMFSQHLREADHEQLMCEDESCFRRFGSQSAARHHTLVHQLLRGSVGGTPQRPKCCAICATIEKWWEHKLTDGFTINHTAVHGFVQNIVCRCCGKKFSSNDMPNFTQHFRNTHATKLGSIGSFVCSCGSQFSQNDFQKHIIDKHLVHGLFFNPMPGNGKLLVETTDAFRVSFGIGQS